MIRYIAFALGILIAGASNSATCRADARFIWPDYNYIRILDEDALSRVKERLSMNWPQYVVEDTKIYGINAPEAIIQDRYPQYLIEIGCGKHVTDGKVVPMSNVARMTSVTMSEAVLIDLCKQHFPQRWEVDGGELFVKVPSGVLRYRGTECSLLAFD